MSLGTRIPPRHRWARCARRVRHDDEQVDIAVLGRLTPGVGTEENDLVRLELLDQSVRHLPQQCFGKGAHSRTPLPIAIVTIPHGQDV